MCPQDILNPKLLSKATSCHYDDNGLEARHSGTLTTVLVRYWVNLGTVA